MDKNLGIAEYVSETRRNYTQIPQYDAVGRQVGVRLIQNN